MLTFSFEQFHGGGGSFCLGIEINTQIMRIFSQQKFCLHKMADFVGHFVSSEFPGARHFARSRARYTKSKSTMADIEVVMAL